MVAHEDKFKGVKLGIFDDSNELTKCIKKHINVNWDDVVFFCVGSDRSTGDSLAPLVGTYLEEQGYTNVIGNIDNPVHAINLDERIKEIPEGKIVVALDASLGKLNNVGKITFTKGAIKPGAGLDKELTPVGDYGITGVVNVSGFMEFFVLQSTKLSLVMRLAKNITNSLVEAFPLQINKSNEVNLKVI